MERGAPTPWFTVFRDLNPIDIYFYGNLKSTLYATALSDTQDTQQWIQNGSEMILTTPGIF